MARTVSTISWSLRRRIGRLRAIALAALHRELEVGTGAVIGRRCRLILAPGAHVAVGTGAEIDDGVTLSAGPGARISIGDEAFLGHTCTIAARSSIEIGRRTYLAELVSVRDHDHDPDHPPSSAATLTSAVGIGADCWLASKVTVLRGVFVGDRTVVGAHAVVAKDLPADAVAVGIPAAVVRVKT